MTTESASDVSAYGCLGYSLGIIEDKAGMGGRGEGDRGCGGLGTGGTY